MSPLPLPALVALFAFLETSFLTGLLVPAGPVLIAAVALAADQPGGLTGVLASAFAGALAGDLTGFWIGRRGGGTIGRAPGRSGRIARRIEPRARALIGRHPWMGVTIGRLLSFVRTLMPPFAGMSGIPWTTFLLWDFLGVAGWLTLYAGIGLAADESWDGLRHSLGTGGALAAIALVLALWGTLRGGRRLRRRRRIRKAGPDAGERNGPAPEDAR